jgi:hypothetical protein
MSWAAALLAPVRAAVALTVMKDAEQAMPSTPSPRRGAPRHRRRTLGTPRPRPMAHEEHRSAGLRARRCARATLHMLCRVDALAVRSGVNSHVRHPKPLHSSQAHTTRMFCQG